MNITKITFKTPKYPSDNTQAIATITFDNQFKLHGVRIVYTKHKGAFIVMPYYISKNGMKFSTFHPTNNDVWDDLQKTVLASYYHWCAELDED